MHSWFDIFLPVSFAVPNNYMQVSLSCDASPATHISGGRTHSSLEQWKIYTFFYVWFDFHSSWCSLRKQWMLCFQEMTALEHKVLFVSGKHSCGAVMMYQPVKALRAQAKGLGFSVTKRKPKLVQHMLYLIKIKLPFFPFSFKYFLFSLVQLGFGLHVFLQRTLFFLQFNLTAICGFAL